MLHPVLLEVPLEGRLSYTHVELWRRDSRGAWALTALAAGPAHTRAKALVDLVFPTLVTYAVQGMTLSYKHKGSTYEVLFSGAEPLSGAEVAAQVVAQSAHLLVTQGLGGLRFETRTVGAMEDLTFLRGDAAKILDLPVDQVLWGTGASLPLSASKTRYSFVDPDGASDSRYQYRLISTFHPDTSSEFSFLTPPVTELADIVTLRFRVLQTDGSAAVNSLVTVYLDPLYTEQGFSPDVAKDLRSDGQGWVQLPLRRGSTGNITLPGARINRRFRTPADPAITEFNPFGAEYGLEEDAYTVRKDPWNDTAVVTR